MPLISRKPGSMGLARAHTSLCFSQASEEETRAKAPPHAPAIFIICHHGAGGGNGRACKSEIKPAHRLLFPELTSASEWGVCEGELPSLCSELLNSTVEIWEKVQTLHIQAQNWAVSGASGEVCSFLQRAQLPAIVTYHKLAFLISGRNRLQ